MRCGRLAIIWLMIVVGAVSHGFGCGHTPAPDEPVVPVSSNTASNTTTAEDLEPAAPATPMCPCPVAESEPPPPVSPTAPPPSAPECSCPPPPKITALAGAEITNPGDVPDGLRGWFCYELRRKRKDKDYLGVCRRTERACNRARDSMRYLKGHLTPCQHREKASCFQLEDLAERELFTSCYSDPIQCLGAWADTKDKNEPYHRLSRCQEDIE